MAADFEAKLQEYAEVIVRVGLNLQPGQRLMIGAPSFGIDGTPLEAQPLVRLITLVAYKAGARYVAVNWDDEELHRIRVKNASADTMSEFATWKNQAAIDYIDDGDACMLVYSQNPELMSGLDAQKVLAKQQTEAEYFHNLRSKLTFGTTNWLIVGAAISSWASKVFPGEQPKDATTKLWQTIFEVCRINQDDPLAGWESHISELASRQSYMNHKKYDALKYTATGTDLHVGLPEGHIWQSASLTAQNGITHVANIPSEELFTMPHRGRINGVVAATKPLSYGGSLVENFSLVFSEGRVVDATARTGQATLDSLLSTDEASRSLGEVALVPHSSPISQTGLLFYNILFDENASSHLALGSAYRFSLEGGQEMTADEFATAGGNESMIHVDLMIGGKEMSIDGITADGATEAIMRNGDWAFSA